MKGQITPTNGDYLKTANYSASPSYVYNNNKRILDKYEVSNNIIVHTKSLDKISTIIDKSLELGATTVDSLNFSLSEKMHNVQNCYQMQQNKLEKELIL